MPEINLQISEELILKLREKIKGTNFKSIQEYINYILDQIVSNTNISTAEQAYTKEEEEAMNDRLKEMGYV